ncbi:MAG: nucleotidyltransferase domain-containing protein [Prevotellaceae bacterium]|jgi:predicted nucleotidyltransferase|nr:nucleotidyltransferase domain-containing protein [Prevotellaceae bacterium]
MDKNDVIALSRQYLEKVRQNNIDVLEAWIFGSYAKGNYNEDSDVDIALVLPDNAVSFDTDVRLMVLRKGAETLIETHTYRKNDFLANTPVIAEIKKYGFRI